MYNWFRYLDRSLRRNLVPEKNLKKIDKRTYTKPQVTEVSLVAGEAVLGTCKTSAGGLVACIAISENCGLDSPHS
jgi:hypothetical protein